MAKPMVASIYNCATLFLFCIIPFAFSQQPLVLKCHNGPLLKDKITVNLIWYGKFTPSQRSIIVDFILSLSSPKLRVPSASSWWETTQKYKSGSSTLVVGKQVLLENYPLGKILKNSHLPALSRKFNDVNTISVILTAKDVAIEGFCMRCGTHGSTRVGRGIFFWVGNSETQCPGQCAWPFHQPIYGPQTPPLVAPNGDVGVDGMVINLATLLANTGPGDAPLEAVSACTGIFGSASYPGYPGNLLVEKSTGASYNANGVNGRKYLLPAMWDPKKSTCETLV
ncbi:Protein EXORDIUM-like 2 [Hibiscus syriacus]|uniref:Protein EXORDIUM-like 2 n=1 Tax=Hibiscus syriacus TaxID=106335 RepID=A0A6A3BVD0_HIBSY|nr:Protein EXORDIUM-like 2 [Hibiscus syriacus]